MTDEIATVSFETVDVFTSTRFGGNPLAVIGDARALSDDQMQAVAREFNYAEVAFVLPPRDPANTAHVRIFTPAYEVPFAGHPNVGTAFALARRGEVFGRKVSGAMRFEEAAGLVEVRVLGERGEVVGAEIRAPRRLEVDASVDRELVAACASLPADQIVISRHEPVRASLGLPFVLAEVADVKALAQAVPNTAAFVEADKRHPHPDDRLALFLYVRLTEAAREISVRARMFAPLSGTYEDPATGSASAALGAYLYTLHADADLVGELVVEQGVEMGRPSRIGVRVQKTAGVVEDVVVGGRCVPVMKGTIQL